MGILLSIFAAMFLAFPALAPAQIQIGTVGGSVTDPAGARLTGARVTLLNALNGYSETRTTDERGEFTFNNLPFDGYSLQAAASGFQTASMRVSVRSNAPIILEFKLNVAARAETLEVDALGSLIESESTSTETDLSEEFIRRAPGATGSRQLQNLIATTPGWTTQNNGLLHVRGVDDGVLYVVDGIPTVDRIDSVSASSFDTDMIRSLNVMTGNIPAEFGGRSGAVVTIQPRSGIDQPLIGSLRASAGSFQAGEIAATAGGSFMRRFGFFVAQSASRSDRFLDPVDLGNSNNHGGALKLNARADWHPTVKDILLFNLSGNGSDFRVPNRLEQELARQRQRQELRDNSQSVSWQRIWSPVTVTNLAYFRRDYSARLLGGTFDTPIFAEQDRRHVRHGFIASLTRVHRGHTFKTGLEASRVAPREFFTFAITDQDEAEEQGVSEAALAFDRTNPFVFRDRNAGRPLSIYVQDLFTPMGGLTLSAGLRYDRSTLPVADQQLSPRIGAVYHIARTKTALRASFNRLYMAPQVENLLLADSEQARRLSPFASETGGGATIRPEKVSAYEAGVAQDVRGLFKLDVAYWHRAFRNFDDPNVFFNTTVIFPNSVARGFARGLDVRLDLPRRRGWSGYVSYTNSRILQIGPINGGLFLTDEFVEIGPGTRFVPDHDQRNVGSFNLRYYHQRSGWWAAIAGRHESGVSLEVEEERLEELISEPGAELVNFARRRVKPWTTFDLSTGADLFRDDRVSLDAQVDVQNITNRRFAYNFGSPFEGTHFGYPRLWSGRITLTFR
jgi:hypothetical protein